LEKTGRLKLFKEGFHKTFWVANGMELFERLAYYGQQIVFMIYMRNKLGFSESVAGQLSGIFGGLIYLLHSFGVFRLSNGCFSDKFHLLDRLIIIGNH